MPITFEQPQPYDPGTVQAYGMLQQQMENARLLASLGGRGGGGVYHIPEPSGGGGGGGGGGQRPPTIIPPDQAAEMTQAENFRLQQLESALGALRSNPNLSDAERADLETQMRVGPMGLDILRSRQQRTQQQMQEMQLDAMKRQVVETTALQHAMQTGGQAVQDWVNSRIGTFAGGNLSIFVDAEGRTHIFENGPNAAQLEARRNHDTGRIHQIEQDVQTEMHRAQTAVPPAASETTTPRRGAGQWTQAERDQGIHYPQWMRDRIAASSAEQEQGVTYDSAGIPRWPSPVSEQQHIQREVDSRLAREGITRSGSRVAATPGSTVAAPQGTPRAPVPVTEAQQQTNTTVVDRLRQTVQGMPAERRARAEPLVAEADAIIRRAGTQANMTREERDRMMQIIATINQRPVLRELTPMDLQRLRGG